MITYPTFHIDQSIHEAAERAMVRIAPVLAGIDETTDYNQQKMMAAFAAARVSESHFAASTGYGYGDRGREALDQVYAFALGAEDALVRHNFVCGTHALTVALFGVLRPGDTMLSVTGVPYDTLQGVIGLTGDGNGSLREFGIRYEQVELTPDGKPDYEEIARRVKPGLKMAYIQRSRGYSLRPSLFVEEIGKIAAVVKEQAPDCIVMVDNCYGEFVEEREPTEHGADLAAGSLIKNPGGGIAPSGAYIVGRADLVELAACRLTAPGIGKHVGATLGHNKEMFQGIFMAPFTTCQNIKTAILCAAVFEELGFAVHPASDAARYCTIQAIRFAEEKKLVSFCQGIQKGAPVDAFVTPQPWDMPGYQHQVIMAAGTFVQGATSELSADAPIKEPYIAYMQGGLAYSYSKLGLMCAVQHMLDEKTISL